MEPRGSIAGRPLVAGQHTADEAQLAVDGAVVVHTGYRFQDGTSCCVGCFPVFERAGLDRGRGYRMSVYRSRLDVLARCVACGVPFPGETAQQELDRRRGINPAHGSPPSPGLPASRA